MSALPLSAFPLPPSLRSLLSRHGFSRSEQLSSLSPSQLSRELGLPLSDCVLLLRTIRSGASDDWVVTASEASGSASSATSSFPSCPSAPALAASLRSSGGLSPPPPSQSSSASALSFSPHSALALHCGAGNGGVTASSHRSIFTLCQKLDGLLGDGVRLEELTEFCGVPGVGKSQLGIQLAMDVGIPPYLGGVDGECVYIDSEGSFMASRAREIAEGLATHIHNLSRRKGHAASSGAAAADGSPTPNPPPLTAESLMRGVHVFRVFDYVEQLAVVSFLPAFLRSHPRVRLVVLDSVAFHFRRGFDDFSVRSRLLSGMAQQLIALAKQHTLAVVAVNQLTTRIAAGGGGAGGSSGVRGGGNSDVASLAPALGEVWSHACTSRVLLYWRGRERWARILKSPSRRQAACKYDIRQAGVRDANSGSSGKRGADAANTAAAVEDGSKRSRVDGQPALP